jgi:hypothetical protein
VRAALLIYGALNAILYAGLTPLWEGFDEPFHYGIVQHLWTTRALPVQKRTTISEEIWRSFPFAPAGYIVQRNLPMVTTFEDYSRLPQSERLARRRALDRIDPALAAVPSNAPNYESQQAPLAYAILAPLHALWSRVPLPERIWRLRLVCSLFSVLATGLLLFRLCALLALDAVSTCIAVFLTFSSQMFYAATAHVTNDWLSIPLFVFILAAAVDVYREPRRAAVVILALGLAAGLLTKAYFLALAPVALAVVFLRRGWRDAAIFTALGLLPAAPWYIRNLVLYRDLAGLQENVGGVTPSALLADAARVPWPKALIATATTSLWEGNSSATTFGSTTIWLMLLLLIAAALCFFLRRPRPAELVVAAGLATFVAALLYNTVIQYRATRGAGITPAPWYVTLLFPPAFCLLSVRLPRILRVAMCCLWAYVISASYIAKLIPMYGGYGSGPARLAGLVRWYTGSFPQIRDILATTAMVSPLAIFLLTALVAATSIALAAQLGFRTHKKQ